MNENIPILEMDLRQKVSYYNLLKFMDEEDLEVYKELQEEYSKRRNSLEKADLEELQKYQHKLKMQKDYKLIRFGFNLLFDIYDYINEIGISISPKTSTIMMMNNGQDLEYKLIDFYSEIEQREALLNRNIQIALGLSDTSVFEPR